MEWAPAVQPPMPWLFDWRLDVLQLFVLVLHGDAMLVRALRGYLGSNDLGITHADTYSPETTVRQMDTPGSSPYF